MSEECPECGGTRWATATDGLAKVASVSSECVECGYVTSSVVDLGERGEGGES